MNTNPNRRRRGTPVRVLLVALLGLMAGCADPEAPDPARLISEWRTYYNRDAGIEFRYPYTLALEVDTTPDGQLAVELQWVGRGTTMFKLETQEMGLDVPDSPPGSEVMVGGERGSQSTIEVDGEELQRIRVTGEDRVYLFEGKGTTFEKVLDSVEFIDPEAPLELLD